MVLEKTLESPLGCKEIQPVHSEGDQPWDVFGRNDAKTETLFSEFHTYYHTENIVGGLKAGMQYSNNLIICQICSYLHTKSKSSNEKVFSTKVITMT